MSSITSPDKAEHESVVRIRGLELALKKLLRAPSVRFDGKCRRSLPERQGVYRIFDIAQPEKTIRAGRTKRAAEGLRQRIYQNHLMGTQRGNIRAQLVKSGRCGDVEIAKRMLQDSFAAQFLVVEDEQERVWLEHFMLAALQPEYCD